MGPIFNSTSREPNGKECFSALSSPVWYSNNLRAQRFFGFSCFITRVNWGQARIRLYNKYYTSQMAIYRPMLFRSVTDFNQDAQSIQFDLSTRNAELQMKNMELESKAAALQQKVESMEMALVELQEKLVNLQMAQLSGL